MPQQESRFAQLWREMRITFVLALPIVIGQLSSMAMNIVDTVLAGHYHPTTLAAVALGSSAWSVVILICIGVLMAISPSVAQLNGAQRRVDIGKLFRQAVWLALGLGITLFFIVRAIPLAFNAMHITPEIIPEARAFIHAISWGAPALALYFCFRNVSEGIAWTRPTLIFGVLGIVVLVPLGYALMYLLNWGARGLGYAIVITLYLQCLGFFLYLKKEPHYADLGLFERFDSPQWTPIAELLRIGLPMGFAIFMEGGLFVATAMLIGQLGVIPLAAHQAALLVASLTFMVPLGIAMATTVRVGHAVGAEDYLGIRKAAKAGYALAMLAQTLAAGLLIFAGSWLAGLITSEAAVISLAATLMIYAAIFQYPDGIQAMSNGALRGLKDTKWPMIITVTAYWLIGMPMGYYLGIIEKRGAPGLWIGLICGLSTAAILLTWRFWRISGHYQNKQYQDRH